MRSDHCVMHGSREALPCPDCESQGIFGREKPLDSAIQWCLLTAYVLQAVSIAANVSGECTLHAA
jgi:hypothetical protein